MLPLTDTVRPRRPPWVTLALVVGCVVLWLAYQLPEGLERSVDRVGFRACALAGDCVDDVLPWPLTATASMFAHGGWAHLVGNMVFLLALGMRVEDRLGRVRYLLLYLASGYLATALDGATALLFSAEDDTNIPTIGASGAISGVMGAYLILFPFARIVALLLPVFFVRVPALGLLAVWFVLQALAAAYGLAQPAEEPVGIAFVAHAAGFVAGALLAALLTTDNWLRSALHGWGSFANRSGTRSAHGRSGVETDADAAPW